jgi:hypothetical protein
VQGYGLRILGEGYSGALTSNVYNGHSSLGVSSQLFNNLRAVSSQVLTKTIAPTWTWAAWNGKITTPARFNTLSHATPKGARFLDRDIAMKTIAAANFGALRLTTYMWTGRRTERPASEYPSIWQMQLSVEAVIWAISQEAVQRNWSALLLPGNESDNCVGLIQLDDPETAPLEFGCAVLGGNWIASAQESAFECKAGWYRYCFLVVEETSSGVYKRLGIGITAPRDGHKDWKKKTLTLI